MHHINTIKKFRIYLREFEREIALQNNDCCSTGISIVQCHILLEIGERESTSVTELAQTKGLDKSTISRTVDGLFNLGLINRDINPKSRRQTIISLTENGKNICHKINQVNDRFFSDVFKEIEMDKLEIFVEVFEKISNKMTEIRQEKENNVCCK